MRHSDHLGSVPQIAMVLLALALSFGVPRATRIGATGKYFYFGLPLISMVVKIGNMGAYTPSARQDTAAAA